MPARDVDDCCDKPTLTTGRSLRFTGGWSAVQKARESEPEDPKMEQTGMEVHVSSSHAHHTVHTQTL